MSGLMHKYLGARANVFSRQAYGRFVASRADYSEAELQKLVKQQVDPKTGSWTGKIPEDVFAVTERGVDLEGADIVPPRKMLAMFIGFFATLAGSYQAMKLFNIESKNPVMAREYPNGMSWENLPHMDPADKPEPNPVLPYERKSKTHH